MVLMNMLVLLIGVNGSRSCAIKPRNYYPKDIYNNPCDGGGYVNAGFRSDTRITVVIWSGCR